MSSTLGSRLVIGATAVVIIAVVAGIYIVGSPMEERLQQLDSTRVSDLTRIMSGADHFWTRNERLPGSLAELAEDPRIAVNIVDAATTEPYEYRPLDEDTYELCATFDRESTGSQGRRRSRFWKHAAGRYCFELEVDKTKP